MFRFLKNVVCQDPDIDIHEVRKQLENLNIHKTVGVDRIIRVFSTNSTSHWPPLYRLSSKDQFTVVSFQKNSLPQILPLCSLREINKNRQTIVRFH